MKAEDFIKVLESHSAAAVVEQYQSYYQNTPDGRTITDTFMGVPMGTVFAVSKDFVAMPPDELTKFLESPIHEVKAGALSIMDKQAEAV